MDWNTIIMIGSLAAAVTAMWTLIGRLKKSVEGIIKVELQGIRSWLEKQQGDIEDSKEERMIMYGGIQAVLKRLVERGENGVVQKALEDLEKFALRHAHKGLSYKTRKDGDT
jgi:hypothetical protein